MEDLQDEFEVVDPVYRAQDGRNIEDLLKRILHNQENQDEQMNKIQTTFSMQMNELKRSFSDMEDRVCKRLDNEKDLQRDNLAGAMKLILSKMSNIPDIMQVSQVSNKEHTHLKQAISLDTEPGDTPKLPGNPPSDDLLPPYSSSEGHIRSDDVVNAFRSQTMLNSLSIQVTSGFDRMREEKIRELEHDKQQLEQDKQQLECDKQQLTKDKDFIQDQLYKTLSDVIVRVEEMHSCIAQMVNSPNASSNSRAVKKDDLRQEENLPENEIKNEFLNLKSALLKEIFPVYLDKIKTIVTESFGDNMNKTMDGTYNIIQKCFGQQLETISNKFHDGFETTKNELVRIVSNNPADIREQNNSAVPSVTVDELRQEFAAINEYIHRNTTDLHEKFDSGFNKSVTTFKAEITEVKTELEYIGEQSQTQNGEMKQMLYELKNDIKQVVTCGEKTNQLQPHVDFGTMMDKLGELMKKTVRAMDGIHKHEMKNVKEEVQSLREDVVLLETRPNVNISKKDINLMLADINGQVQTIPYDDLTKRINAIRADVKDVVKMRDGLNKDLTKISKQIIQEVHRDIDQRMQFVGRDLTDVIEKEAQLSRESDVDQRKDFEFHFRIQEYEKRVGTGIKLYGCPWYIPQFDSCIRCYVCFLKDGNMYIKIIDGRYPKVVGLRPKPEQHFSFKMELVGSERSGKIKLLKDAGDGKFDEAKQITRTGSWGYDIGVYKCETLKKEGFVEEDEMLIRCLFTV